MPNQLEQPDELFQSPTHCQLSIDQRHSLCESVDMDMAPHALLEIPIFGPSSAAVSADAGAARLELNATGSYPSGGTTPSVEELVAVNTALESRSAASAPLRHGLQPGNDTASSSRHDLPIRVMIRPRGPPPPYDPLSSNSPLSRVDSVDFQYTPVEVKMMESSIHDLKQHLDPARGDGFVFGALAVALDSRGADDHDALSVSLDTDTCRRLVAAAHPFACVFHRAFDILATCEKDQLGFSLDQIKRLGFGGILTSGGLGNAADHARDSLADVVDIGHSCGLEIIVGGGVRSANLADVMAEMAQKRSTSSAARSQALMERPDDVASAHKQLKAQWFHSSCLTSGSGEQVDAKEVSAIALVITDCEYPKR